MLCIKNKKLVKLSETWCQKIAELICQEHVTFTSKINTETTQSVFLKNSAEFG